MAIIDKFEVTISSGGIVLQEYNVPEDHIEDTVKGGKPVKSNKRAKGGKPVRSDKRVKGGRRVNRSKSAFKYVEAVPGAKFSINYSMSNRQLLDEADCVSFLTEIDGVVITSPIATDDQFDENDTYSEICEGDTSGNGVDMKLHPLCWTNLSMMDGRAKGNQTNLHSRYQDWGTIRVKVCREEFLSMGQFPDELHLARKEVPESAVKGKAVDMGIEFQDGSPLEVKHNCWETEPIGEPPLAIFTFYYRSKSGLQALDIVPRTAEPIALEDRDDDTLTPAEMLELIRRQKARFEAEKVKVKLEKAEANLKRLAGIKRKVVVEDDDEISVVAQTSKKARRDAEVVELSD